MRPATDLCWYCQKGVTKLARSANLPDAEKSAAVRDYEDHLRRATMERSCYTQVCKAAKDDLPPGVTLGRHAACSFTGEAHYSFDFAQQVHYPSDPPKRRSRVKPRCRTAMMTFHHHPRSQPGDVNVVVVAVEDVEAKKSKQTALFRARCNSFLQN